MQQAPIVPASPPPANEPQAVVGTGKENRRRGIISTILILVAAPLVALMLTSYVFHPYEVEGQSMETSLQDRDRLIVWKLPVTMSHLTKHKYMPKRGEVIVFIKQGLDVFGVDEDRQLIKRVIGLPGDRVVVADGHITIYNNLHPDGYNPDLDHEFTKNIDSETQVDVDMMVPAGEVFVCGDNRNNSLDSRYFGTVPAEDIIGELIVRIFPINKFKSYI